MRKIVIILSVLAFITNAYAQTTTTDESVVINGVKWATRNVDEAGAFAPTPESAGKLYQWNRKKAWNTTDTNVIGWDNSTSEGTKWEKTNDPSPKGWRVPIYKEIMSLLDTVKVSSEWTTQNGINGHKFTDKASGNTIFLPTTVGYRHVDYGALIECGSRSYYWSSTVDTDVLVYMLYFLDKSQGWGTTTNHKSQGFLVRPVASSCYGQETKELPNDITDLETFINYTSNSSDVGIIVHEVPKEYRIKKQNFYKNAPKYTTYTDRHFVVIDPDGYVNLRNEPTVNSDIMATIPTYTLLQEAHGQVGNWRVVYYRNFAEHVGYYGFVHESRLVQVPQDISGQLGWEITKNEPPHSPIVVSRALELKSIGQEKDFTLHVFFFNDMQYGFVWEEGKNDSRPISLNYGDEFLFDFDYKDAGYDFGENPPKIVRYFYDDYWIKGVFAFDEQEPTNMVQTNTIISKVYYNAQNYKTSIDFVIKKDVVLSKNAKFSQ